MPNGCSYGRSADSHQWVYFEHSTPNASNGNSVFTSLSNRVIFTPEGGSSTESLISLLSTSDKIYYSTDGSDPINGTEYTSPFTVSATSTVRAVGVSNNQLSYYTSAHIYHESDRYSLPVMMLSMNDKDLNGTSGIYTNYSRSGVEWERPVSLAYYDPSYMWSVNGGIRIQGGNSVSMAKKSFRVFFRNGYGDEKLKQSPFPGNDDNFTYLVLRGGYDDDITTSNGTMLRDPISAEAWKDLGEIATESSFSSLFLNNEYWGIYNVRESINEDFVDTRFGHYDFDLIRFLKTGTELKYGSMTQWDELWNIFQTADFSLEATYEKVDSMIDMNSMLNLLSFVHCTQFRSWTWGTFGIKPNNGKWQWTIWDTDRSFEIVSWNGFTEYANTSAEKWSNFLPQKLIENELFQQKLINRICDHLNTQFQADNIISKYDSLIAVIEPDIALEYERWNTGNLAKWDINNANIKTFMKDRPAVLYQQMKDYFSLTDTSRITINIEGEGSIKLNSLTVVDSFSGIYMQGVPLDLIANPAPGYVFKEWKELGIVDQSTSITLSEMTTLTAVFKQSVEGYIPLVINEIMYHPLDGAEDEWVEIYNPNTTPVDISGWQLTDSGDDNYFNIPEATVIGHDAYYIICRDMSQFSSIYPNITNVVGGYGDGPNGFKLSNNTDDVILISKSGVVEDQVTYMDGSPWAKLADGTGASLQLSNPTLDNTVASHWLTDGEVLSTPGVMNKSITSINTSFDEVCRVYPNPVANEMFTVDIPRCEDLSISMYNLMGERVFFEKYDVIDQNTCIDVNRTNIAAGMYVLSICYDSITVKTEKIILK